MDTPTEERTAMKQSKNKRIGELEDELLKDLKRRMEDVKRVRDAADKLVAEQDEHVKDVLVTQRQWIDAFGMVQDENGDYCWQKGLAQQQ